MNKKFLYMSSMLVAGLALTACSNGDAEFDDYEGGVPVYFANQYPVRTLVMGEDEYDTTLDNQHMCQIQATMGGSYHGRDIMAQIEVDNSLCNNLYFADGTPVKPMPESYYQLSSGTMKFEGDFRGRVNVQLTDAFFNDPDAVKNTYVIPVVLKSQAGADSILCGRPIVDGETPQRTNSSRWDVQPKDFTLYCVKFISKYDANYLRRGVDNITFDGKTTTVVRAKTAEPKDQEVKMDITTLSLNSISYPVSYVINGVERKASLIVSFDASGSASVTSGTEGVKASGSGMYVEKAEKKAWNGKDRDGLYLDYKVDFGDASCAVKDTLVWRDRGVKFEEFATEYKE